MTYQQHVDARLCELLSELADCGPDTCEILQVTRYCRECARALLLEFVERFVGTLRGAV